MRLGANLQKLGTLVESMRASDPQGYERVTEVHYETTATDVHITFVEIDGNPHKHPVDLSKGPWSIPV